MEPLYNSLSEHLRRNHKEWLARGGNPDGVSSSGEEEGEALPDLEYPPQESFPVVTSTGEKTFQEMMNRRLWLFNTLGRVPPVPAYPEPPKYLGPPPYN